ncbi:hypothetical protein NLI96_g7282 [Meripilus lineatus]|uniref:Uncharacterized protein n=1 Tax=Meripilus lineatus TaxID=2056292 RepID=A0AAD5V165_9APHY|nr:hypothetical protein NLI96_g7282 [Physisporinus lineatus]
MLSGLDAYGDDSHSEGDDYPPSTSKGVTHHVRVFVAKDFPSKHPADPAPGSLRPGPSKAQIVIRRPVHSKPRPRPRFEDGTESVSNLSQAPSSDFPALLGALSTDDPLEPPDEVVHIRSLLKPPSIPELDNWGIPPESEGKCDPSIEV